ncbi:SusD/RagB family nutrient-binding outer membrane lipoprotein [[Flexibacter] sp. ATCC 35208]|uniref:SusD/RagB family nutrient-binding outer membrane lipoprotein n=1 Tax=[Flexibacter] sp. ATCC 35208 TaxID=1936242 RepID=UPI0009D4F83E|nr:SusD/RagB family nutrient-binding outer membrane lipoprotein [[Flexibacter] sp. ATCC 35208]OMP78963.1 hypothetical protein BW716_12265 [[Flexibacter] sp. ATCC 35208]
MRKRFLYIAAVAALFVSGCTKKFDSVNTDPNATSSSSLDPNYLLSYSEWYYSNTGYNQLLFESMWVQVLSSTYGYYSNGDKYVASTNQVSYQDNPWNADYQAASYAYEMMTLAKEKGKMNLYYIGLIMKNMILQRVTDSYGNVPFSQALQAKEGITEPVYDTQDSIYYNMLAQVDSATEKLDASADEITSDLFYDGDIAQWKKLGYSLMLKMAMRLTKVDLTTAKTYAEKAYTGGVFSSIDDNAFVLADNSNGYTNSTASSLLVSDDFREVKWSQSFIDYLRTNNDPRLSIIGEIPEAGLTANNDQSLAGDMDSSVQLGMPNGYDLNGGTTDISNAPGYPGATGSSSDEAPLGNYSRPTVAIFRDKSGPNFVLTYAETELLLAEAAVRGWSVGSAASVHYANGVAAAMQSLATFSSSEATISAATAATYTTAHPLDVTSTTASLKQINEQYWITDGTLFNHIEAWINWRRSGYPELTPVVYSNNFTNGTIPRRIPYQSSEKTANATNYNAAVALLSGGDNYTSRMWWDVAQ